MDILVTGSSGFVGRHTCLRLIKAGHRVVELSLDISQPFHLDQSFDCVIHLAAYNITNIGDKSREQYQRVNVLGTEHLLKGVTSKRFLFLSTIKVYKNEGIPLTENSPVEPAGAYEQSKQQAESICQRLWPKDQLIILRSANIMGPGQAPKAVLPLFFQKASLSEPLDIIVSGRSVMQWVDVDDVVDAIELSMVPDAPAGIFNIAASEGITIEALARAVIVVMKSSSLVHVKDNAPEVSWPPLVCEKIFKQLGWKAKISLFQTLDSYKEGYERSSVKKD